MNTHTARHPQSTPASLSRRLAVLLTLVIAAPMIALAQAQVVAPVPLVINYQGRVTDATGLPIGATGTPAAPVAGTTNRKIIFRIYDSPTGGTRLWTEEQTVTISTGEFSVLLGNGVAATGTAAGESRPALDTVFTTVTSNPGTARYLEVMVDEGGGTIDVNDTPISPRQQLTTTAYSFRAKSADSVASGTDLQLNSNSNYGLGYYGSGRTFNTTAIDGPVLYGLSGGALGVVNGAAQSTALRWNATGQIGIGSADLANADATTKLLLQGDDATSPPKQLTIRGNTTTKRLYLGYNTTGNYGAMQAYNGASTATNLVLNEIGGNVGIGTGSSPAFKLDVAGTLNASGAITAPSLTTTGTVTATMFSGSGASLTSLNAASISTGSLADARLSANVALLDRASQAFTGATNSFSGNVGIGFSTAPAAKLDVRGPAASTLLRLQPTSDNWFVSEMVDFGGTQRFYTGIAKNSSDFVWGTAPGDAAMGVGGAKKLFISANGVAGQPVDSVGIVMHGNNVGIGTTAPAMKLDVVGATWPQLRLGVSTAAFTAKALKMGFDTTLGTSGGGGSIMAEEQSSFYRDLYVSPYATASGQGFVAIGQTATPTHMLTVNGVCRSTSASFATSSDERVKEHIKSIAGSLERVMKLRPVTFDYTQEYRSGHRDLDRKQTGFIAQEVEKVFPDMVTQSPEQVGGKEIKDFRALNTSSLSPHLVVAVQELARKVETLEKANAEKDTALTAMTQRLAAIEAKDKARDAKLASR